MTVQEKRKGGGAKTARTETVTVRLDPKLRYLAELAARKHRRTLSSYIEAVVADSLTRVDLYEGSGYNGDDNRSISDEASNLWDVDEAERFVKLALAYPDLLNHEEQERWKLVQDSGLLEPAKRRLSNGGTFYDAATLDDIVFTQIRKHWPELLNAIDLGSAAMKSWALATREAVDAGKIYPKAKLAAAKKPAGPTFADMDDDIPF